VAEATPFQSVDLIRGSLAVEEFWKEEQPQVLRLRCASLRMTIVLTLGKKAVTGFPIAKDANADGG
jgi:hypothetical protein